MPSLKTVGIKELKNNLSSYLHDVQRGVTVLISNRNDIIAELHEPYGQMNISGNMNALLLAWAQAGTISLPKYEKQPLELSCVNLPSGTACGLLNSDREEPSD